VSVSRAAVLVAAATVLACGGDDGVVVRSAAQGSGELALPPSATAPRVMREAEPPDTLDPDSLREFQIAGFDSFPEAGPWGPDMGADLAVDAITAAYRLHYAEALRAEGSAVQGRIDRELQAEAERRTAADRGFADWTGMVEALSPEQRARLVDGLNEANIDLARELHGSSDEQEPAASPPG
jgi:hypothetical protein